MAYISFHVARVARMARIAGIFSAIAFGAIALFAGLGIQNSPSSRTADASTKAVILVWVVFYLFPGILLWACGRLLEAGRFWVFIPIVILAIFDFAKLFLFQLMGGWCTIALRLPTLLLVAFVLNATPDMRDHYRRWRRDRKPRGFPVIVSSREPAKRPPPPARGVPPRPPRRGQ